MAIELQKFAAGDVDYIAKHNRNIDQITALIEQLQELAGNAIASSDINVVGAFKALFGNTASLIGAGSYLPTISGGNTLNVAAGFLWKPSAQAVVSWPTTTSISFVGVSSGTWYIGTSPTGQPERTNTITDAAYSVVWNGSALSSVTKLLPIVWGAEDDIAAQSSAALAVTYTTLDDRLEAGETKAVLGDLARTYLLGRVSKSVAGNSNVALTEIEANNIELNFTGLVTGDINIAITLASAPRAWLAVNNTSGGYKLTLKGSGGSGVALPEGAAIWVYSDGANILPLPKETIRSLTYNATLTADFSRADTVKVTLGGNSTITLTGAVDKQKCILELKQDDTGGRTVTLVGHRFGSDLTEIELSTGAGLTDKIGFIYDATADKFDVVGLLRGY